MTREEMERQAGKIVFELAEARKLKACLESRLKSVRGTLLIAMQVLTEGKHGTFAGGKLSVEEGGQTVHHEFLAADEIGSLMASMENATKSVSELEEMHSELVR